MIGVVQNNRIFEFRDYDELAKALDFYGSKNNCDTILVVDTSDKVKAVVYNELFTFMPNLDEETKYYIFGINGKYADLSKNDQLPIEYDWPLNGVPFAYCNQRVPKELELY